MIEYALTFVAGLLLGGALGFCFLAIFSVGGRCDKE